MDTTFTIGNWEESTLGNHRAVLEVGKAADAVIAVIPWRRRDRAPEEKKVIVTEAATGRRVLNVHPLAITNDVGRIAFQPEAGPGTYYVYYLPYVGELKAYYPKIQYQVPECTAAPEWLAVVTRTPTSLPEIVCREIQARDEFHSFLPMEVAATAAEIADLKARFPGRGYLVFFEDRNQPVRMFDRIPMHWARTGPVARAAISARRGEFRVFQLGVYAAGGDVNNVAVMASGIDIPGAWFTCFNTAGTDWTGRTFRKPVCIAEGKVQPFWCGIMVPETTKPGRYRFAVTMAPENQSATCTVVALTVTPRAIEAGGDNDPSRRSRLRWLDSTLAAGDGLTKPYVPVTVSGRKIRVLGRELELGASALPQQITSFFTTEMTGIGRKGRAVLAAPMRLCLEDSNGKPLTLRGGKLVVTAKRRGSAAWRSESRNGHLAVSTSAMLEFDGSVEFDVQVTGRKPTDLGDIRLEIPVRKDVAQYGMGLGLRGGRRPDAIDWKWDVQRNQDCLWVGDANAGLQVLLKDETYARPLNTNFYHQKPLVMPKSWCNAGSGGIRCGADGKAFVIACYSGRRHLAAGECLHYRFRLLMTPFKPIDPRAQFATRFYHAYKPVAEVVKAGANTINIHHANDINPFINYPFLRPQAMKRYVDQAHRRNCRVKIYYTVRELTYMAPELFALKSLGGEIFSDGSGGGCPWLQEHLADHYLPAWHAYEAHDAAIINTGESRWHNFYVEGLAWLARNIGIDGIYIDDLAFDRTIMKRVRKVLDKHRPAALIDLHSANQHNERDGFANSAGLYMDTMPYLDRLWFGEYFDYDLGPDFWLVEVSGIPYGLMGEMLQGGGNPWRGMLFGMTARMPWGNAIPPPWKLWDAFGIGESEMLGFWSPKCPVRTGHPEVLATVYRRKGKALISIASWARERVDVSLKIDWKALGLDRKQAALTAPCVESFQPEARFAPAARIPIDPGRGWLLVLQCRR